MFLYGREAAVPGCGRGSAGGGGVASACRKLRQSGAARGERGAERTEPRWRRRGWAGPEGPGGAPALGGLGRTAGGGPPLPPPLLATPPPSEPPRGLTGASPAEKRDLLGAFRGLTGASPRPYRESAAPSGPSPGLGGAVRGITGAWPELFGVGAGPSRGLRALSGSKRGFKGL